GSTCDPAVWRASSHRARCVRQPVVSRVAVEVTARLAGDGREISYRATPAGARAEAYLTVLKASGRAQVTLTAGSVFAVPRGHWHRRRTQGDVTLLTATPTPTDISFAADPRSERRQHRPGR